MREKKMVRVAVVTAANPYRDIRAIKFATSLKKLGYDPYIIGGYSQEKDIFDVGVPIFTYGIKYNDQANRIKKTVYKLKFKKFIKEVLKKNMPIIIHACNVDMLYSVKKYEKKGISLIYDSYEICAHKTGFTSNRIIGLIVEKIEKSLLKRIHWMICVSNSAEKYFVEKYKINNISTITNSPIVKNAITKKEKNQPLNALYIGGYSYGRGIEEYIESGKYIDPSKCKITLRAFGAGEDKFKSIVSQNKLENVVEFLPILNPTEIIESISRTADIGVVLTKATCLNHKLTVSNKIFDYINAGIPVIMSNVDEHIFLNNKYHFGIVLDEISPKKIGEAINSLVTDESLYEELSNNCLIAAKTLNWENQEGIIKRIYDEAVKNGN